MSGALPPNSGALGQAAAIQNGDARQPIARSPQIGQATCSRVIGSPELSSRPAAAASSRKNDLLTRPIPSPIVAYTVGRRLPNEARVRTRAIAVVTVAFLAVAGFGVGVLAGSGGVLGVRVPTSIGSGMVGERVATLWANDTAYGVRSSVPWRDASGMEHESGWPECLARGEVSGITFQGAVVWHDNVGTATILWIDCRSSLTPAR